MVASDKPRKRFRLARLTLTTSVAILITAALTAAWFEQKRNEYEEYEVYSAYLSDEVSNDAHDWGVGDTVLVVIERFTEVDEGLSWREFYLLDGRLRFEGLQTSTRASFVVSNLLRRPIKPKFRLPPWAKAVLASPSEIELSLAASPAFDMKFPNNMGFIRLSGVGFNRSHTQAVFYIDHFCGLYGSGDYVLMEKVKGRWIVRNMRSLWIS